MSNNNRQVAHQVPNWVNLMDQETNQRAGQYQGTTQEKKAQAARDLVNSMTERLEQDNTTLGGGLLYIKTLKLYEQLGYSSMSEYLSCERVGGLGKTQCYKLMDVASVTAPANQLAAPMLQAPPIDTGSARLMLPQELVKKIGTERTYALKRRWRDSSPEEREELLDAAQNAPNRDFYEAAYGETDRVSFEVQGDKIILWQHQIGTQVGTLTTLDPVLRSHVLDRLSLTPRARL